MPTVIKIILLAGLVWTVYHSMRIAVLVRRAKEMAPLTKPFERRLAGAQQRILVAGDSTGFGTGTKAPEESTAGRLGAFYPNAEVINVSVNGARVDDVLGQIRSLASTDTFDLIVLQVGGNDITHRTAIGTLEKDLGKLLDLAQEKAKKVIIFHSGDVGTAPLFPKPIGRYLSYRSRLLRDVYIKVTQQKGVEYVDLYAAHTDDIFLTDKKKYYWVDEFHPSGDGYEVWFEEVKKLLP